LLHCFASAGRLLGRLAICSAIVSCHNVPLRPTTLLAEIPGGGTSIQLSPKGNDTIDARDASGSRSPLLMMTLDTTNLRAGNLILVTLGSDGPFFSILEKEIAKRVCMKLYPTLSISQTRGKVITYIVRIPGGHNWLNVSLDNAKTLAYIAYNTDVGDRLDIGTLIVTGDAAGDAHVAVRPFYEVVAIDGNQLTQPPYIKQDESPVTENQCWFGP